MAPKKRQKKPWLYIIKSMIIVIVIFLISKHKALFFLLSFEALQLWKLSMKDAGDISVDLVFIFGVAGSYYYGMLVGIAVFMLGIINRAYKYRLESRHVYKAGRILPLIVAASLLGQYDFFLLAVALLMISYILKYLIDAILCGCIDLEKTHYHIINIFLSLVFFYIIDIVYRTIPFLV